MCAGHVYNAMVAYDPTERMWLYICDVTIGEHHSVLTCDVVVGILYDDRATLQNITLLRR